MNRIGRKIVLGLCVAAVSGCTVGPNYQAPPKVEMPEKFSRGDAAEPVTLPKYWTIFNDPELNSLIDRAVKNNLDVKIAESRIREARAELAATRSEELPSVDINARGERIRNSQSTSRTASALGGFSGGKTEFAIFQAGFDASWELDVFGGTRRAIEASEYGLQSAGWNKRDVLVTLIGEVARNYADMRGTERRIEITKENVKTQQDTLELTRARFKAGLGTDLDVARAESNLATTEAQLPSLGGQRNAAARRLANLLGLEPMALTEELKKATPIPPAPPMVPVGVPSDLLRRRPDVRRAERDLAASTARIGVATAELFPKFNLAASLGGQSDVLRKILDSKSLYYSIGPGMTLPIFDRARLRANVEVTNAQQEQALLNYQKAVLQAMLDVEDGLSTYVREQAKRERLAAAVDSSKRAYELSSQLYQRGVIDFLTVLDTERSLFAAQDNFVQSDRQVTLNLIALFKGLGGGWDENEWDPQLVQQKH